MRERERERERERQTERQREREREREPTKRCDYGQKSNAQRQSCVWVIL